MRIMRDARGRGFYVGRWLTHEGVYQAVFKSKHRKGSEANYEDAWHQLRSKGLARGKSRMLSVEPIPDRVEDIDAYGERLYFG